MKSKAVIEKAALHIKHPTLITKHSMATIMKSLKILTLKQEKATICTYAGIQIVEKVLAKPIIWSTTSECTPMRSLLHAGTETKDFHKKVTWVDIWKHMILKI